jgi:hypothetical protein
LLGVGIAFIVWAEPISRFYASAFAWIGLRETRQFYVGGTGRSVVRMFGLIWILVAVSLIIEGTG